MYNNNCGQGCGNSGYNNPIMNYSSQSKYSPPNYSPLEEIAHYESVNTSVCETPEAPVACVYVPQAYQGLYLKGIKTPEETFLSSSRPITPVIEKKSEIMKYVKEAFFEVMGTEFPENSININVLNKEAFKEIHEAHNGIWSPGIMGFAINRNGKMKNEIFVKQNNLDRLMLTIGHEIGHVMNSTLYNEQDEEAKAFAFSMAWMNKIREKNIAGIAKCINPQPAVNGVHDIAFNFVVKLAEQGKKAMQIFDELSKGIISIKKQIEVIN